MRPTRRPRSSRATSAMLAGGFVLVPAFSVLAQPADRPALSQGALPPRFVKVQKRIDDVQGLSTSTRIFPIDMRQPTGFGDVFRIQGSAAHAAQLGVSNPLGGDLFARIDGAVTAVFPQSVYLYVKMKKEIKEIEAVPAGTVFFIGGIPWDKLNPPDAPLPAPNQVQLRAAGRVDTHADAPASRPSAGLAAQERHPEPEVNPLDFLPPLLAPAPPAPAQDPIAAEQQRCKRVRELILKAARVATSPPQASPRVPAPSPSPQATPAPPPKPSPTPAPEPKKPAADGAEARR